jgi:shikimate dehydrogenase
MNSPHKASGQTRLAVLGSPISHSKSPMLHRAAYQQLGLDWDYSAIEVTGDDIGDFVEQRDAGWRGLSLTMPLKNDVIPYLDSLDEVASLTGAVNTVLFNDGDGESHLPGERRGRTGFNTDVAGIVRALGDNGVTSARHVVIVGAGSTARSALVAAAQLGAEHVTVVARNAERAGALAQPALLAGVAFSAETLSSETVARLDAELLISTLPGTATAGELFDGAQITTASTLFDVAYHPWPSSLAQLWQRSGRVVVSGLDMLIQQALIQIRIFVAGDPMIPLPNEATVLAAMRAAI